MRPLSKGTMRNAVPTVLLGAWIALGAPALVRANVITDWDEKGVAFVTSNIVGPGGTRAMAMVHVAMFDAVNSIERRYRPYLVQLPVDASTSKEAAAAAAAGAVLAGLVPVNSKAWEEMKAATANYLATLPEGEAKVNGIKLGEAVATRCLEARANDGSDALDAYRPRTTPGSYVPTPILVASTWPNLKPLVMTKPSQFRPKPPISMKTKEWAADYNELKDYGGKSSAKRSAQQTETARFWLMTGPGAYQPFARQLVVRKDMSVIDSARFMALVSVGLTDALIAVFDAKYHYNFWRPITSIRNGDIDGNPATDRMPTWQPIDNTPLHPEYPCAHCISSGAVAAVVQAALGSADIPEIEMTSSTAVGVIHRWTNLKAFSDEIANARIWAGFHYRFSTRVGTDMGRQIGEYVVKNVMQPTIVVGSQ